MLLKSVLVVSLISSGVIAAQSKKERVEPSLQVPEIVTFTEEENKALNKAWRELRKSASSSQKEVRFSPKDVSPDFQKFVTSWLSVKNAEDMANLLEDSYVNYSSYSPDLKFFLAQIHILRHLRGIVWRVRPLFETPAYGRKFLGNKATHVSAVQLVRNVVTGLDMAFAHDQMDAVIDYLTKPSKKMSKDDQFTTMVQFQDFIVKTYGGVALRESILHMKDILNANPKSVFLWDNRILYGKRNFDDGLNQVIGFGPAEMLVSIAAAYEAWHDTYVFAAYNQDAIFKVAGDLGQAFGIDSQFSRSAAFNGLGLTDKERTAIVQKAVSKYGFLSLRGDSERGNTYGQSLMASALVAKRQAMQKYVDAYENHLKGKPATTTMALNPILYSERVQNRLDDRLAIAKEALDGIKNIRDPISGDDFNLNVPQFYLNPPKSLGELMAIDWEDENDRKPASPELSILNEKNQQLEVRNYFYGRATGWNNASWKKYVPTADGQKPDYMAKAKRVMHFAMGSGSVFGPIDLFIR